MQKTPKGLRLHIAIFGRRNVGKSSILNAITRQEVAIVSEIAGTTTDPVEKPMELLPVGPVLFIDTAGLDDVGALGRLRITKTYKVFERADIILLVTEANKWTEYEEEILEEARRRKIPILVIINKIDLSKPGKDFKERLNREKVPAIETSALNCDWETTVKLKNELIKLLPKDFLNPIPLVADLINEGDLVILVIPIDKEAPRGRLILPQQQTIREILDKKASCLVVNERNLSDAIHNLKQKPRIVITDSQVFEEVFVQVPDDILVTSFSILFARAKGDLEELVKGAQALDNLKPADKILIAEACTHHPIGEDIGRIKIPRWINQRIGGEIDFDVFSGHNFPEDIKRYKLIIHCGACMLNRKEMLARILRCREKGVAITNYGVVIAYLHNAMDRVVQPFNLFQRSGSSIVTTTPRC
ncbi:MAG: [FeFe] hydrogenase H-cluster maturation GTPase HydF [Candidatus Omnitrophica bacterium]|nr:[FeFe] hydrogenase H-cluster maturation GTPase HydF [Candidatus Omnitrophota bacterium]